MKKILTLSAIAVIFAGLFTVTSCSKDPLVLTCNMDDMTACLVANPYNTPQEFTFTFNHDAVAAVLTSNSVDISRVTDTKLKKIKAVITSGATNFNQIAGIQVYMKKTGTTGDGDQVATTSTITNGSVELVFDVNGVDLKRVLSEDQTITVRVYNTATNDAICIKLTEAAIEITARK